MYESTNLVLRDSVYKHENFEELFEKIDNDTLFYYLIENKEFLERILISSKDLYFSIIKSKEKNEFTEKIKRSTIKYYLRMSTRAIPFGLNSSIGYFKSDIGINKDIRPSNIWLNELRKVAENNIEHDTKIKIQINNTARVKKSHIEIDIIKISKKNTLKVNKNKLIDFIFTAFDRPIYLQEALKILKNQFIDLSEQSLMDFIKMLIAKEIMVTELKPHTFNFGTDNLKKITNVIKSDHLLKNKLLNILQLLEEYSISEIGEGIQIYNQLVDSMTDVCISTEYLVVDLIGNNSKKTPPIDKSDLNEFVKNISFLNSIKTLDYKNIQFESYKNKFLEKYGQLNEVDLLEVVNSDWGLGLPRDNLDSGYYMLKDRIEKKILEKDTYILNKWLSNANYPNENILLTDEDISVLEKIVEYKPEEKINIVDIGYDIKFSISYKDKRRKFILHTNTFSSSPSAFLGRFNLNKNIVVDSEEHNLCGVSILPSNYPDLGVSNNLLKSTISIGCIHDINESIDVRDIVVGYYNDNLYLKSKKTNKKIIPIKTNLLYYNNFNELDVIHFLNSYTEVKNNYPKEMIFPFFENLIKLPRIEYKNIILHTKKWKIIKNNIIDKNNQLTIETLKNYLYTLEIDSIVNLIVGDMNLTLIWKYDISLNLILNELNKHEVVILGEVLEAGEEIGRDFLITVKGQTSQVEDTALQSEARYVNKVGWDYCYYKIYYEKFNKKNITETISNLLLSMDFEQYFIIYYNDPSEHIRVRFKTLEAKEKLNIFEQKLVQLVKAEDIIKYNKELFYPEINRYGGPILYEDVYSYFHLDSVYYFSLLKNEKYNSFSEIDRGMFLVLNVLFDFFPSYDKALDFIIKSDFDYEKQTLKKFKKNRVIYKENLINLLKTFRKEYCYIEKRKQALKITNIITRNNIDDKVATYAINSIIHMVINRHLYVDRNTENEIISLSRYCLYNLKYVLEEGGEYEELQ